jgi:hypothetical protein
VRLPRKRVVVKPRLPHVSPRGHIAIRKFSQSSAGTQKETIMSKEADNKAIVGRWFKEFWGNPWNPTRCMRRAAVANT